MSEHTGCFSPYMLISSTLQTVFGFDKRSQQQLQADLAEQHQLELRRAREEFQDELEAQKNADMRAKMAIARIYRSEEKFEQTILKNKTTELQEFFMKYLPIKRKMLETLLKEEEKYKSLGYNSSCPLNIVLLHTRQKELNYDDICDKLDLAVPFLRNIVFQRWCDKDVAHNSAILNLHAAMTNIPTLVISPYFQGGAIHFNASMWEAQSETKPMIRPLFSIKCPEEFIGADQNFTVEGRKAIQKEITFVSTIISGCARDSYMLMTQGLSPTLPYFLKKNPDVLKELMKPKNKEVYTFMLNEYNAAKTLLNKSECVSKLLNQDEMKSLASKAETAELEILKLTNMFIEKI